MSVVLGVDIGGSTTKIIGFRSEYLIDGVQVKGDDAITSLYGAIGKFLSINSIELSDVECIVITGVGSSYVKGDIYGIKTYKVDEFNSIGYGGLYLSNKNSALVVSMGTGTAYVHATKHMCKHIGGSGVGGGTLLGLSSLLLNTTSFDAIEEYSKRGLLSNVDLRIEDICNELIPFLPPDTTASNFGNICHNATKDDLSLCILNMIYQTIGLLAIFYNKNNSLDNIVLTGSLSRFSVMSTIFKKLEILHDVEFIIPNNAIFSTAIGCVIYYKECINK